MVTQSRGDREHSAQVLDIAILGVGWIGGAHLADLSRRPDVRVVAVADRDYELTVAMARRCGARACRDLDALLRVDGLDALWICTPPADHREPAIVALRHGLSVYLEKPIARAAIDAAAIVDEASRSGLTCAIGYQWNALELLSIVQRELEGQAIVCSLCQSLGPTAPRAWLLDRSLSGGNLLESASHHLALLGRLFGDPVRVEAVPSIPTGDGGAGDVERAVSLTLRYEDGSFATVVTAWTVDDVAGHFLLDVVSDDALMHLELDSAFVLSGRSRGAEISIRETEAPLTRSNRLFIEAVRAGDPAAVACTPAQATATLRVALGAEQALLTQQPVAL